MKEQEWTVTGKINWIFKFLVLRLDPVIIASHREKYKTGLRDRFGHPKVVNVTYTDCKCNFDNMPEEIPYPFEGIEVLVTKTWIKIIGDSIYYKFPPNFLLTLQERFNSKTK